ncbi:MAG: hypothetical protein ACM3S0_06570 [Acidobacteriota bacterium]
MDNLSQPAGPEQYTIRIKGHLAPRWSEWFAGMEITQTDSGETLLSGPIADQAALHGLLARIRDLNLALVSVTRVEPASPDRGAVDHEPTDLHSEGSQ